MDMTRLERTALFLAFWPVWIWYLRRAGDGSDEPWQLFAAAGAVFFLAGRAEPGAPPRGRTIAAAGLTLYILTCAFAPPIVRAAIALGTIVLSAIPIRRIPPAGFLLLGLSLPIFSTLDFLLSFPLRRLTALPALVLLQAAGFDVTVSGNTFLWNGSSVLIDAPCSGIRMLYTAMLITAFLGCTLRLRWREMGVMIFIAVTAAFLANIFRAASLFFLEARPFLPRLLAAYEPQLHSGIGLILFSAAAIIICGSGLTIARRSERLRAP